MHMLYRKLHLKTTEKLQLKYSMTSCLFASTFTKNILVLVFFLPVLFRVQFKMPSWSLNPYMNWASVGWTAAFLLNTSPRSTNLIIQDIISERSFDKASLVLGYDSGIPSLTSLSFSLSEWCILICRPRCKACLLFPLLESGRSAVLMLLVVSSLTQNTISLGSFLCS